ncbi:MAG: hypothetical protein IKI02_07930 [Oscillospiraceae bacterium]|nr:hypothetical protein [Oscillospiraceae bacterium]
MKQLEYPPRPEGELQEQITQLWEALFRLTERLNAERSGNTTLSVIV